MDEVNTGVYKQGFLKGKMHAHREFYHKIAYLMNRLYADGTLCRFSGAAKLDL